MCGATSRNHLLILHLESLIIGLLAWGATTLHPHQHHLPPGAGIEQPGPCLPADSASVGWATSMTLTHLSLLSFRMKMVYILILPVPPYVSPKIPDSVYSLSTTYTWHIFPFFSVTTFNVSFLAKTIQHSTVYVFLKCLSSLSERKHICGFPHTLSFSVSSIKSPPTNFHKV